MHDFTPEAQPREHPQERHIQLMIGKVANLYGITVQTLRHYDKIGLFRPEVINPETGYRYYSLEQLRQLEYILFLRRLGFSLQEIEEAMTSFREGGDILSVLEKRGALLERQIAELQELKARISALTGLRREESQEELPCNAVGIRYMGQPRHLRFHRIEPLAVSDPEFALKLLDERKNLLGGIPTIQAEYSMGALVDVADYRDSGCLRYCGIMLDPGFYGSLPIPGMEAVPAGYFATIRFRRCETRPEDAYDRLIGFIEQHSFAHAGRILELNLDPSFSSISRLGELTELQLRLEM